MSAVAKEIHSVKVTACKASEQPWAACSDSVQAKVLSVDETRHAVEVLFKIAKGYKSERHRHMCETTAFVLEGKIRNETTGIEFGPGDFCYQPYNDEHVEHFVEDTIVYATYRGDKDKLVEFYGDDGKVCGEFKVSDFTALLPQ
jgi:quercetin dioxygenase-like cupin family protein